MVGVGLDGSESSLARVSVVNYYGEVLLDEFVQQRERVVDYRTQYSGIRPSDMVRGKQNSFRDLPSRALICLSVLKRNHFPKYSSKLRSFSKIRFL